MPLSFFVAFFISLIILGQFGRFLRGLEKVQKSKMADPKWRVFRSNYVIQTLKNGNKVSNISMLAWSNNHSIYFTNSGVINKGDYRVRKILESWHTAISNEADNKKNNSKPLLRQVTSPTFVGEVPVRKRQHPYNIAY